MKQTVRSVNILLLLMGAILLPYALRAGNERPSVEKKKTYSKTYPLDNADRVELNGRFGFLKIMTWNRPEVKMEAEITVKAEMKSEGDSRKEEAMAQDLLDRISIADGKENGKVFFKTKINDQGGKSGNYYKNTNTSMSINLTVYLPADQRLSASNEFGPMTLPDYDGPLDIVSKFGGLTAGKLQKPNRIDVEFGYASIQALNGGSLTVKFSRAELRNLSGDVKAHFEFCSGVLLDLRNNLHSLDVSNSYTELLLNADRSFSGQYDIYTNFSKLENQTDFNIPEEEKSQDRGPSFNHQYRGKSGSAAVPVKVHSEFGNVVLGHQLSIDVHEKGKEDKGKIKVI